MAYEKPKNYIEVKDRIIEFRAKHPEGSLQSGPVEWVRDHEGKIIGITIQATAYRTPDDPRPGYGTAFEFYPGKTPYTKGSEVQNAETSAWGRALIAVGAADATHGIASADEVRRAQSSGNNSSAPVQRSGGNTAPFTPGDDVVDPVAVARDLVTKAAKARKIPPAEMKKYLSEHHGVSGLSQVSDVSALDGIRFWAEGYGV